MNHPDMASAPLRPALFHSPAIVRADGKLHCTEIASFAEVTPAATFLRHLVHVGEVLAQIAVTGFDKTGAMLEPDAADISRVERHDIGFDFRGPDIGHDQIMGDFAVRDLDGDAPCGVPSAAGPNEGPRLQLPVPMEAIRELVQGIFGHLSSSTRVLPR